MNNISSQKVCLDMREDQTIIELCDQLQPFHSEVYLKKTVRGSLLEVNVKSFLGLVSLLLKNGEEVEIRAEGIDHSEALRATVDYFTSANLSDK
jgi:phosphocarrier protein HPr